MPSTVNRFGCGGNPKIISFALRIRLSFFLRLINASDFINGTKRLCENSARPFCSHADGAFQFVQAGDGFPAASRFVSFTSPLFRRGILARDPAEHEAIEGRAAAKPDSAMNASGHFARAVQAMHLLLALRMASPRIFRSAIHRRNVSPF